MRSSATRTVGLAIRRSNPASNWRGSRTSSARWRPKLASAVSARARSPTMAATSYPTRASGSASPATVSPASRQSASASCPRARQNSMTRRTIRAEMVRTRTPPPYHRPNERAEGPTSAAGGAGAHALALAVAGHGSDALRSIDTALDRGAGAGRAAVARVGAGGVAADAVLAEPRGAFARGAADGALRLERHVATRVHAAGVHAAGVDATGVHAAGVDATGVRVARGRVLAYVDGRVSVQAPRVGHTAVGRAARLLGIRYRRAIVDRIGDAITVAVGRQGRRQRESERSARRRGTRYPERRLVDQ